MVAIRLRLFVDIVIRHDTPRFPFSRLTLHQTLQLAVLRQGCFRLTLFSARTEFRIKKKEQNFA
jgi:hypothetical protein